MRVKPVASTGSTRVSKRDLCFDGYTIPAGTLIMCPFDAVHHNPRNWDDPDLFKPVSCLEKEQSGYGSLLRRTEPGLEHHCCLGSTISLPLFPKGPRGVLPVQP